MIMVFAEWLRPLPYNCCICLRATQKKKGIKLAHHTMTCLMTGMNYNCNSSLNPGCNSRITCIWMTSSQLIEKSQIKSIFFLFAEFCLGSSIWRKEISCNGDLKPRKVCESWNQYRKVGKRWLEFFFLIVHGCILKFGWFYIFPVQILSLYLLSLLADGVSDLECWSHLINWWQLHSIFFVLLWK